MARRQASQPGARIRRRPWHLRCRCGRGRARDELVIAQRSRRRLTLQRRRTPTVPPIWRSPRRPRLQIVWPATDALVHPQDDRERDLLDGDGVADFAGGFAAAAAELGNNPALYHLDTSRTDTPVARTLAEEVARIVRGRLTNPRWINGMLRPRAPRRRRDGAGRRCALCLRGDGRDRAGASVRCRARRSHRRHGVLDAAIIASTRRPLRTMAERLAGRDCAWTLDTASQRCARRACARTRCSVAARAVGAGRPMNEPRTQVRTRMVPRCLAPHGKRRRPDRARAAARGRAPAERAARPSPGWPSATAMGSSI